MTATFMHAFYEPFAHLKEACRNDISSELTYIFFLRVIVIKHSSNAKILW